MQLARNFKDTDSSIFYSNSLLQKLSRAIWPSDFIIWILSPPKHKEIFTPQVKNPYFEKSQDVTIRNDFRMKIRNASKANWKMVILPYHSNCSQTLVHSGRGETKFRIKMKVAYYWGKIKLFNIKCKAYCNNILLSPSQNQPTHWSCIWKAKPASVTTRWVKMPTTFIIVHTEYQEMT